MNFSILMLSLCASFAAAGVVITPIKPDQVVAKGAGDCWGGVTTPSGCGYVHYSISARTNTGMMLTRNELQAASLEMRVPTSRLENYLGQ
jgi:hypothetical protein